MVVVVGLSYWAISSATPKATLYTLDTPSFVTYNQRTVGIRHVLAGIFKYDIICSYIVITKIITAIIYGCNK